MSRGLWSRLTFLLYLTKEYNEEHEDLRAVFRMDNETVDIFIIQQGNNEERLIKITDLSDLTEERVYGIYKAIKETDTTDDQ